MTNRSFWRRTDRRLLMVVLSAMAVLGSFGCAAGADADCGSALASATLEPGVGFGGLRLGMTGEEVEAHIGPAEEYTEDRGAWLYPSCGFALMFDREGRLGALLGGDGTGGGPELAERFTVQTADGLGMGSSREDLLAALGEPTEVRAESPAQAIVVYRSQGLSWMLEDGRVHHVTIRGTHPAPAEPE